MTGCRMPARSTGATSPGVTVGTVGTGPKASDEVFSIDAGDQFQQGRLAAAGRADNRHEVSCRHPEIDFPQKMDVFLTLLDCEMDVF